MSSVSVATTGVVPVVPLGTEAPVFCFGVDESGDAVTGSNGLVY